MQTQESATWLWNLTLRPPTSADRMSGNIVEFWLKCSRKKQKKKKEIKYKIKCFWKFPVDSGSSCVAVLCDFMFQSSKNTIQHPSWKIQGAGNDDPFSCAWCFVIIYTFPLCFPSIASFGFTLPSQHWFNDVTIILPSINRFPKLQTCSLQLQLLARNTQKKYKKPPTISKRLAIPTGNH